MQKGLTSLNDLLVGDRVFRVPRYQRNYSWEKGQLQDLWDDIYYLDKGKKHYFGTVVLKEGGETKDSGLKSFKVYEIVDGQQRITSTLILLRELALHLIELKDRNLEGQLKDMWKDYLRYDGIYKLELLGDDRQFFEDLIIEDKKYPVDLLTPSRRRLLRAKSFFRGKLDEEKRDLSSEEFREFCRELKNKIDQLEIVVYPVEDDADSVLIFETVNDRGKPLSNLEKTKSFLMHMVYLSHPEGEPTARLRKIEERFGNMFRYIERITSSPRGKGVDEDDVQRYHFIIFETEAEGSKKKSARYLEFLKDICRSTYRQDKARALRYASEYSEDLEKAFFALTEIVEYNRSDRTAKMLEWLFSLERVANFYPLLLAYWTRFRQGESVDIEKLLELIEKYAVRVYVIARRRADTGAGQLYSIAHRFHHREITASDVLEEMGDLITKYASDSLIRRLLDSEDFYETRASSSDMKYILYRYENFLRRESREPLDIRFEDIMSRDFEIEHIWPRNPEYLSEDQESEHDEFGDRLGNLTLASKSWNASWRNKPFQEKKEGYGQSILRVQKELADWDTSEWRSGEIQERGRRLVEFCVQEWKIPTVAGLAEVSSISED